MTKETLVDLLNKIKDNAGNPERVYQITNAAINEALAQPEQDKLEQAAFDAWWDTQPRLNETNPCIIDSFEYWAWEGWHAALAQPEQEPVAWMREDATLRFAEGKVFAVGQPFYTTPPQPTWVGSGDLERSNAYQTLLAQPEQERNFCPRCGKRTADLTVIHTCTPPRENT